MLGGSAVFFSYAASYFTDVRLVAVVGDDWPAEHTRLLQRRKIDTAGLKIIPGGKTFRWRGKYRPNMNDRDTLEVHLNVFGDFRSESARGLSQVPVSCSWPTAARPSLQMRVLDQVCPGAIAESGGHDGSRRINVYGRDELLRLLKRIDGLVMNDHRGQAAHQGRKPGCGWPQGP